MFSTLKPKTASIVLRKEEKKKTNKKNTYFFFSNEAVADGRLETDYAVNYLPNNDLIMNEIKVSVVIQHNISMRLSKCCISNVAAKLESGKRKCEAKRRKQ